VHGDWWARVRESWKARIGGFVAGGGIFWSAVQRAQDAEWLAGKGMWVRAWFRGLSERPWGDDLIAFLASPFAPLLVITIGVALVAWAAFQSTRKGAAIMAQPAAPASTPARSSVRHSSSRSIAGTRAAKLEAMDLAREIRGWADRWDSLPAGVGGTFEMIADFEVQFGARIRQLQNFVPMLMLVYGGQGMIDNTDAARRIANEQASFANSFT
jgi:hypothetical protein